MKIAVTIAGLSPLLMHRFPDGLDPGDPGARDVHNGRKPTPREQAELSAYRTDKGELYWPGANLFSAIIDAGSFHKLGKRQITTAKSSLVPAGIGVDDTMILFGTKEFEVDSRRIVNQNNGNPAICHRARIDVWKLTFTLDVDETMFDPRTVRDLVDTAGKKIGIGAYRPRRRGPFGKFKVTHWSEEKTKRAA